MVKTFGLTLFAFIVLLLFLRRFSRRKNRVRDLESYVRRHERAAEQVIHSMREEQARFDAHEALAPVEAGVLELLDLHGRPSGCVLSRQGDCLILARDADTVRVAWSLRTATISLKGKNRNIYGNGRWELRVNCAPEESYTGLAPLMGRLSGLVRALARGEALEPVPAMPERLTGTAGPAS